MEHLRPVEPLNITSPDVYSEWMDWQDQFDRYKIASGLGEKDEKIILNTMLYMMGPAVSKVFRLMTFPEGKDKEVVADIVEQFELYFKGKSTNSSLRQAFKNRVQKSGESLSEYVESVQQLALTAGYKLEDPEVTDTITKGVMNRAVKAKLLDLGDDITIERWLRVCRSAQITADYFKQEDAAPQVHYAGVQQQVQHGFVPQNTSYPIRQHQQFQQGFMPQNTNYPAHQQQQFERGFIPQNRNYPVQQQQQFQQGSMTQVDQPRNQQGGQWAHTGGSQRINTCVSCGLSYGRGQCPAQGKVCRACQKPNHFARVCRSKRQSQGGGISTNSNQGRNSQSFRVTRFRDATHVWGKNRKTGNKYSCHQLPFPSYPNLFRPTSPQLSLIATTEA